MEQKDYRLSAIMYTDIAGFSRMMERDEAATLVLLAFHNDLIGEIAGRHHGTIIKTIGDALLIDFKNTVEALQSAMEIQDKLYAHNKEHGNLPLLVRIGVHLGDIYFFENDALGEGINIAARLQSLAKPGCICFSQDVYNQVLNKIEFRAEKLGKVSLKNITKEIHAFEIVSPNIEFDPEHGKPRPGYPPGSYLGEHKEATEDTAAEDTAANSAAAPAQRSSEQVVSTGPVSSGPGLESQPPRPTGVDRSYTEEASRSMLTDIRRAILQDTKAMGRRMSVDEALSRYRFYGVEAEEVIAAMAEQGLLTRSDSTRRAAFGGPVGFGAPNPGDFGGPGGFDGRALGQNIRAAVEGIVGEIQRNVAQNAGRPPTEVHYRHEYDRHIERHRRRMERHAHRHGLETDRWDGKLHEHDEWKPGLELSAPTFEAYRNLLEARAHGQRGGLIGHLTSYMAVNAGLWYVNLTTSPHGFLWAAVVSAGWGIGLISSIVAAVRSGSKLRETDAMPEIEGQGLEDYKKLNKAKDSMAMHTASTIGVSLFLGVLQALIFGLSAFWLLIPIGAMLIGFFSHLASYSVAKPRLQKKILSALGIAGGWRNIFRQGRARREEEAGFGPYAGLYREAETAKNAIVDQLRSGQAGPMREDMVPSLQEYLGQVRLLALSANEIDRLVEAIPMAELGRDKAELASKESAASETLKSEYRKSIAEIEKQEKAYQELRDQSEVVKLRLGSSVNQLKQMRIDIARIKAAPGYGEGAGLDQLKRRTEELSHYLEDLRTSFDESRNAEGDDPFAELERLEREAGERPEPESRGGPESGSSG